MQITPQFPLQNVNTRVSATLFPDPLQHRDEIVLRHGNETEVVWCDKRGAVDPDYSGAREKAGGLVWCDLYVCWSPQGTYLTTFHRKGLAIWGSNEFVKQGRFAHSDVKECRYTRSEEYMLSSNLREGDDRAHIVWDVRSGRSVGRVQIHSTEFGNSRSAK